MTWSFGAALSKGVEFNTKLEGSLEVDVAEWLRCDAETRLGVKASDVSVDNAAAAAAATNVRLIDFIWFKVGEQQRR